MGIENGSLSKIEVMNFNYSKMGRKKESVLNVKHKNSIELLPEGKGEERRIQCECYVMLENISLFGKVISLEL